MNPLLAAVVEFVGLCMFMQGRDRYAVHVVLPNVQEASAIHRPAQITMRNDIALVQSGRVPIERRYVLDHKVITMDQHTAIIAWLGPPKAVVNWTPKTLKPVPQYQYIELKGEQIRIVGNGQSADPGLPEGLPSVTNACSKETLRADYVSRSAAIVKLAEGTLTSCRPQINGEQARRVDTKLTFETTGPIVIETVTKPVRRLELKAEDLVIIANVPTAWVNSAPDAAPSLHGEAGHYTGFYTLLANNGAGCQHQNVVAPVCKGDGPGFQMIDNGSRSGSGFNNTRYSAFREGVLQNTGTPATTSGACPNCFITYACSNSQYP